MRFIFAIDFLKKPPTEEFSLKSIKPTSRKSDFLFVFLFSFFLRNHISILLFKRNSSFSLSLGKEKGYNFFKMNFKLSSSFTAFILIYLITITTIKAGDLQYVEIISPEEGETVPYEHPILINYITYEPKENEICSLHVS